MSISDNAIVTLFGTGFNFPFGDVVPRGGTITGVLQDGTDINLRFGRQTSTAHIVLAPAGTVPEPSAFALLALGALGLAGSAWKRKWAH
jgi:hypothetical protein